MSFVGRKNPTNDDERAPKYLNGAGSPLFSKGEHLFGIAGPGLVGLDRGARAVLVEVRSTRWPSPLALAAERLVWPAWARP